MLHARTRLILPVVICLTLCGCLLNTPDRVIKRFVSHLKNMRWHGMAELVDWPQSAEYMPGLPATNEGEDDRKKEVMIRVAENLTNFPVREKTEDQVRHEFLYLELAGLKHMKDGKTWAWREITVSTERRSKKVQILVMKIHRLWRIVLTEGVFQ